MGAPPVTRKTFSNTQVPVAKEPAAKDTPPPAEEPAKGWQLKPTRSREVPVVSGNLSDATVRRDLATRASQLNPVASAAGNSDRVCGGAAVVSALLLRSPTPATAKANARALQSAFESSGAAQLLPASVNRDHLKQAFERFGAGAPTPADVNVLQQAAYAVGRSYAPEADDGLSSGQLAALVANLKSRGATLGPETRFVQVHDGAGGHWVAQTPEALLNSSPQLAVKPEDLAKSSPQLSADVTVRRDGLVELRTRQLSDDKPVAWEGAGWRLTLDPKGDVAAQLIGKVKALRSQQPDDF